MKINDFSKHTVCVTRLEVIDDSGRAYVNLNVEPGSIWYDIQDDGRTLKIFCTGVQNAEWLHNVQNQLAERMVSSMRTIRIKFQINPNSYEGMSIWNEVKKAIEAIMRLANIDFQWEISE